MKKITVTGMCFAFVLCGAVTAEQFLFIKGDHVWKSGWRSYDTGPDMPQDWTRPNDYANGTIYWRFECTDKPKDIETAAQLCMWQKWDGKQGETCRSNGFTFKTPGVYYIRLDEPMKWWKKNGGIDYTAVNFRWVRVMLRKPGGKVLTTRICKCDISPYVPITYNVQVYCVSKGSRFETPDNWDGAPQSWDGYGLIKAITDGGVAVRKNGRYSKAIRPQKTFSQYRLTIFNDQFHGVTPAAQYRGSYTLHGRTIKAKGPGAMTASGVEESTGAGMQIVHYYRGDTKYQMSE